MDSSVIAKFIGIFNMLAIIASVFFAVCGVAMILGKRFGLNIFGGKMFFGAFCVAALVAFAAEFTVFNFQPYLKFFAGPELHTTGASPENPNIILTSDGTAAGVVTGTAGNSPAIELTFKDIDREVTSLFADVVFRDDDVATIRIRWTDEIGVREVSKRLYKYLPHENHLSLQSGGKVSDLSITFLGNVDLISVAVNKRIPFYFSGLRLLAVSILFFAIFILLHKKLRAKASYYLFEYKFDPANKKQNLIYAAAVAALIFFSWICVYTTPYEEHSFLGGLISQQYNKFLVDALIDGRTWLDYGTPEKLLGAERPHDVNWLVANGYEAGVDYVLDWVWHDGKFYSFAGIVPAVILYLPYKLITGNYLTYLAGVFLFTSILVCLLAALWRYYVKKYMPDSRFAFYLLSFLALFFAGGLLYALRAPYLNTVVQAAGLMFAAAGILLLHKSVENEKVNRLKLFFACLCFALIAGCRPNIIFAALLIPVVLWKYRSWKLVPFVVIPFVMVAIPLCMYNYVRFDSFFSFGRCIITYDMAAYQDLLNPIGTALRILVASASYLFLPFRYSLYFPFVEYPYQDILLGTTLGAPIYRELGGGIINFPIVFCLFFFFRNVFRKEKTQAFPILSAFLIIAAIVIFLCSQVIGFCARYTLDFAIFIIIPSLFCAYYWCNDKYSVHRPKTRLKVVYVLLALSVLIGLSLFVTGSGLSSHSPQDPALYRYLEYSLGILRNI